jgi:hypothetical protein
MGSEEHKYEPLHMWWTHASDVSSRMHRKRGQFASLNNCYGTDTGNWEPSSGMRNPEFEWVKALSESKLIIPLYNFIKHALKYVFYFHKDYMVPGLLR